MKFRLKKDSCKTGGRISDLETWDHFIKDGRKHTFLHYEGGKYWTWSWNDDRMLYHSIDRYDSIIPSEDVEIIP